MKTVHTADMVCHLWANKGQDTARTAGQNLWFTGPVLYSYGSHFVIAAHLENGRILWNDASYSNTTSKHQTYAWRALSRVQSETRLHVPKLTYDHFRNLQRLHDSGDGRTLPDLAQYCADEIVTTVESMSKMREGFGKIKSAFLRARSLEKTADELRAYVAKGKRIPAWPIPRLPDELPTGDALKAMIRDIAKGRLIECHNGAVFESSRLLSIVARTIVDSPDGWQIGNLKGTLSSIERHLNDGDKWHQNAIGRKSAKISALRKQFAKLSIPAITLVLEWEAKQARAEIRMISQDIARHYKTRKNQATGYRGRRDSGYFASKLANALQSLPDSEQTQFAPMLARIEQCNAWDIAANYFETARSDMDIARSYTQHNGDALRHYSQCAKNALLAMRHPPFERLHGSALRTLAGTAQTEAQTLREMIAAKNARLIDEWKAGGPIRPGFDAGTFARIKGDTVETSRGAVVPLAHACRLARIARRIIAAGGKQWTDGAGPMVGSFRVHSIGADGRAVIGCHEFEGAESLRMLALLESCTECAKHTADE